MVLTGAGRGFCSGLDLTDPTPTRAGGGTEFPRSGMRWQERIAELTVRLHRLHQSVIAAVNGPAYGGGFAIAAAADIRLASETARFCTQFIKLGLGGCDIGVSYIDTFGAKLNAPTDTVCRTAACALAFRCGSACCARNTGPRRFTS